MSDLFAVGAAPEKRRNKHPEANLQTQVQKWCRESIRCKHKFKAFDRSKNTRAPGSAVGRHLQEWKKGIRAGTLDTCVITEPNAAHHWIELKAPGVSIDPKEDDKQIQEIADIRALGGFADWTNSVVGYARLLEGWGVPLYGLAMVRAEDLDRLLLGRKMRTEGLLPKRKRGRGKPRALKPTQGALAVMRRFREKVR